MVMSLPHARPVSVTARPRPRFDLEEYFDRIGYRGDRRPTLDNLCELHRLHPQAIPIANLDAWLGIPEFLEVPALARKLVQAGRGGDGFEHNLLFRHVLRTMGYRVAVLSARVLAGGHLLLRVEAEGRDYIADPGFVGLPLTAPLQIVADRPQATPHETFRLLARGDQFILQALSKDEWHSLYTFGLGEAFLPYDEPPLESPKALVVTRRAPGGTYVLRNTRLAVSETSGGTDFRTLSGPGELLAVLADQLRLTVPATPGVTESLARLWMDQR